MGPFNMIVSTENESIGALSTLKHWKTVSGSQQHHNPSMSSPIEACKPSQAGPASDSSPTTAHRLNAQVPEDSYSCARADYQMQSLKQGRVDTVPGPMEVVADATVERSTRRTWNETETNSSGFVELSYSWPGLRCHLPRLHGADASSCQYLIEKF
jgi:hypothetical protein